MRYVIRTDAIRSRCLEAIAELPLEPPHAVEVGPFKATRTHAQNDKMQKLVRTLANAWGKDHDAMREALNMTLMGSKPLEMPSGETWRVPETPTSRMTVEQMGTFIDELARMCAEEGLEVLP